MKKEDNNADEDKKLGEQNSVTNLNYKNNSGMEKFDKIIRIICSVHLCYYITLIDEKKSGKINNQLRDPLITLVNSIKNVETIKANEETDLENNKDDNNDISSEIHNKILKSFIQENGIKYFSDFLRIEKKIY